MERNSVGLAREEFDVVIIGGGAFGAAAAWDASSRGLKTALLERGDFGAGASAECFKMVHGGIRYLQHADLPRLRFSCRERSAWLRIAPHLVTPLPILIPTYGRGRQGKAFLGAGMYLYDLLTLGRNDGVRDASRHIPMTRLLSRAETLNLYPDLDQRSLTGAAIFDDGQMYNPARLVLAFIKSAVGAGAVAANYVEATEFLWNGKRVCGVKAKDHLDGSRFDIRSRLVLNAAGPGAEYLLNTSEHFGTWQRGHFSRDAYFVVDRKPRSKYALAVPGRSRDRDAIIGRSARHLFSVPWRDYTLIGVWHKLHAQHPDRAEIEESELEAWIAEINASYPAMELSRDEIISANCGLVPFGAGTANGDDLTFGKESRFIDHRQMHGVDGLVTLIGIRYTTARGDAATALNLLLKQLARPPHPSATDRIPLAGGDIADFAALRAQARARWLGPIMERSLEALLRNHGTEYSAVTALGASNSDYFGQLGKSDTLAAEVVHAVAQEMAVHLDDVVRRRTDLASGAHPGRAAIAQAAELMQKLLSWSDSRRQEEMAATEKILGRHHSKEKCA